MIEKIQKESSYYDNNYFDVQKKVGIANAKDLLHIFQPHITESNVVLDFGCGGGYLLGAMKCKLKLGFDINHSALKIANLNGLITYTSIEHIQNESIDIIISNSALEHTPTPFEDLCKLYKKLKKGGRVIFRVPHEPIGWDYSPKDWNYHLFTWSPMALGNLFNECGFKVIRVTKEKGMQPPFSNILRKIPFIYKLSSYSYRIIRIIIEEIGISRLGVDGYSILIAEK